MAESMDIGTRGASYLCLDKPEFRYDVYPEKRIEAESRRNAAKEYEVNTDRGYVNEASRASRQRERNDQLIGIFPINQRPDYDEAKKKAGKSFLASPLDSIRYKSDLRFLPNEEDPYAMFLSSDEFGIGCLPMDQLKTATEMINKYGKIENFGKNGKSTTFDLFGSIYIFFAPCITPFYLLHLASSFYGLV